MILAIELAYWVVICWIGGLRTQMYSSKWLVGKNILSGLGTTLFLLAILFMSTSFRDTMSTDADKSFQYILIIGLFVVVSLELVYLVYRLFQVLREVLCKKNDKSK